MLGSYSASNIAIEALSSINRTSPLITMYMSHGKHFAYLCLVQYFENVRPIIAAVCRGFWELKMVNFHFSTRRS